MIERLAHRRGGDQKLSGERCAAGDIRLGRESAACSMAVGISTAQMETIQRLKCGTANLSQVGRE
jgi:hypothetical protein